MITLIIVSTLLSYFIESGMLTDVAALAFYVAFICRLTLSTAISPANEDSWIVALLLRLLPSAPLSALNNIAAVFTFDFAISSFLTLVCLVTLVVPIDDPESFEQTKIEVHFDSEGTYNPIWNLVNVVILLIFTRWLSLIFSPGAPASAAWYVLQCTAAFATYLFLSFRESFYDNKVHWKSE